MKVEVCSFSGHRIHPGHGVKYVKTDNRVFLLVNGKSESLFLLKKNPRKVCWTMHYRKAHKKGLSEDVARRRTRKSHKLERAIVGASLETIRARRTEKPEKRAAAREATLRKIKDLKKKKTVEKTELKKTQKLAKKQDKAVKVAPKARPSKR